MNSVRTRRGARRTLALLPGAALCACLLAFATGAASATATLDQSNPGPLTSWTDFNPMAETFNAGSTGTLDMVQLNIFRLGNPGDLTIAIEGTSSLSTPGLPDDQDVLATQTVAASGISTESTNVQTVAFDTPATIHTGKKYAIVVHSADPTDAGDHYNWGFTGNAYAGGVECAGLPWDCTTYADADFIFATYVTAAPAGPPAVGLGASSLAFGTAAVGTTTSAQTLTVTNTAESGSQSLQIGTLSTGGANPTDFVLGNDGCSNSSIAPGASCTVDVSFAPTATGARSANLSIPSNAGSTPDVITLAGSGMASADVQVGVSGPGSAKSGSTVSYLVAVSNAGPSTASNVVMTFAVPAGAMFQGVSTTHGTCAHPRSGASSGTVTCSLGDLAKGASGLQSVALKITLKKGGTITGVVRASSVATKSSPATPDPDQSNNITSFGITVS
jgi:uncharacterized repeat protein (TIGR01451 family)